MICISKTSIYLYDFVKDHGSGYPNAVKHLLDHTPEYLVVMTKAREIGLEGEWGYVLDAPIHKTLNDIEGKLYK